MRSPHEQMCYLSAAELGRRIKNKDLSPVEVIDAFLERIEAINPKINAFCTVASKEAKQEAIKAEQAIMRGDKTGPLHGVPIGIKDLTPTAGIRTTLGSKVFADNVPDRDAVFVRRIKEAGGIVLGKTNTPEFGHKGTTDNLLFGTTKNPWNPELTAGGSSGGSAAAVATGLIPFAEGSDGGGSIRIPASLCGVFGLKPSYGRVPFDGKPQNMFASQHPFLHYGALTRTVEDASLLLSVMAGPDPIDPYALPLTGEDFPGETKKGIDKNLRVAYSPDLGMYEIDETIQGKITASIDNLRKLGCEVEEIDFDFGMSKAELANAFSVLWFTQIAAAYGHLLPQHENDLSKDVVKMIHIGQGYSAMQYKEIELIRTKVWHKVQDVFNSYDLLLCPTLAVAAFPHTMKGPSTINGKKINPNTDWLLTGFLNLTGHPAASLPVGFTDDQRPIGLQVIGRRMGESSILRLSYAYEQAFPWSTHRPQF